MKGEKARWRKSAETKPKSSERDDHGSKSDEPQLDSDWSVSRTVNGQRRNITTCIAVVFLSILVGLSVYYCLSARKGQEYENIISDETEIAHVEIQEGLVFGIYDDSAVVFKGIPYAKPPIKWSRWNPPIPCDHKMCWNGILNASKFGSICAQQDVLNVTGDPRNVIGSEDCLFINVWAPRKRSNVKLLPVLVYIHGGNLMYASGNFGGLHPSPELISEMNIVGVSFNYRINAFGFLALKSLAEASPSKTSGNYGFMDQILALKWVQTNIRKFGGDPNSVTLIGQSSGGTSLLALLASPKAAGLFHRAILMSASPIFNKTSKDAAEGNEIFVKNSNFARASLTAERACLYELNPRQIQDAIPWDVYPYWRMADQMDLPTKGLFDGAVAVVDNDVVPEPPLLSLGTAGRANDVPVIIGTTAQEIDAQPVLHMHSWQDYEQQVHKKLDPFLGAQNVTNVLRLYNETLPDNVSTPYQFAYTSMASDLRLSCPNNVLAMNASVGLDKPVYRYIITNSPSKPVNIFGYPATFAFHLWDLVAFFGFPDELGYTPSEKDKRFMANLREEFGEFIYKGTVKKESWKEYPGNTALFTDNGVEVRGGYHPRQCDVWISQGFFSYAWIN